MHPVREVGGEGNEGGEREGGREGGRGEGGERDKEQVEVLEGGSRRKGEEEKEREGRGGGEGGEMIVVRGGTEVDVGTIPFLPHILQDTGGHSPHTQQSCHSEVFHCCLGTGRWHCNWPHTFHCIHSSCSHHTGCHWDPNRRRWSYTGGGTHSLLQL